MLSARTTLTPTEAAVLARVDSVEPVELAAVRLGLHAAAASASSPAPARFAPAPRRT
ncbi:hypothetical protein ACFSVJ_05285 [Prauserella oleivorans]